MSVQRKVQRNIVSANGGKRSAASTAPKKSTTAAKTTRKKKAAMPIVSPADKKRALGMRIGAAVLWVLAVAFEVLTILAINKTLYIPEEDKMGWLIVGVVLDLICVFAGAMLWKKSNRIDPASEKNKIKFFLWNQMGLIAALIAFVPLVVILLKDKELDEKTKKIVSIVAVIAALLAVGTSIDYTPVSQEDLIEAQADVAEYSVDGTVYWTRFGRCYHLDEDCHTIRNSEEVYPGTVKEAFEFNREKPCYYCADAKVLASLRGPSDSDLPGVSDGDLDVVDELLAPAA